MGLASSLSTALTGMSGAETSIDVVGNNLANANTVGFKASTVNFATQFSQTYSLGSSPSETSGGTNPTQIGLGSLVAAVTPNFSQGTVEISSSSTDLAIEGDGFFIVQANDGSHVYTRNGVFELNSENELVTDTGNRVLGYGVDENYHIITTEIVPVTIPLGTEVVAEATTKVTVDGTLTPTGDVADAAQIIESGVLGDASYTYPEDAPTTEISGAPDVRDVDLTAVFDATGTVPAGHYCYKLVFSDGSPTATVNLEGTPSAATVEVAVDGAATNAIQLDDLDTLTSAGSYPYLNIYRATGVLNPDGITYSYNSYSFIDSIDASTLNTYTDLSAAGTTALNENVIDGEYEYYICFGKSGSDASRPSELIGPLSVSDGSIHITDLPSAGANPDGWDSWIIYRNAPSTAGSDRYFEVAQISFTATDTTFTDKTPDTDLYTDETTHTAEIDMNGPKIQSTTWLTDVIQRDNTGYEQLFTLGSTLRFTGEKGGNTLASQELTIDDTTTVGDLLTFMEGSLGIQKTTSTNGIPPSLDTINGGYISPGADVVDGKIRITGNNGTANAVDIGSSGLQLITGSDINNVDMSFSVYQEAVGESAMSDVTVFDSLGIACGLHITAVLESSNDTSTTYRWFADSPDNQLSSGGPEIAVGTGLIRFDSEGKVISVTQDSVTINRDNVASDTLEFTLDFSGVSGLASDSLLTASADGCAPGTLSSFIIGEDGIITGVFSNGMKATLGEILLARFNNPAGLESLGNNLYAEGLNSGSPVIGTPGEYGIGTLVAGAVELSNTDVGGNLIDLILASTMYRGNARVISTVQTLFDTLLQLQR
jgi:flagellar hook protein FlgE